MEPYNKPYVDPNTDPGDTGTERWADEAPENDPEAEGRPQTDEHGAIKGSPADVFDDGDAISAENEEG
jgi:hypothetical protein